MSYLLDTNIVSETRLRRGNRGVRSWFDEQRATDLHLSVITVLELEIGASHIARRDSRQGRAIAAWTDSLVAAFQDRLIAVDLATVRAAAALHVPDPAPERDALIAATALVHGLTVVTRNVRDFERTGVRVINPWED